MVAVGRINEYQPRNKTTPSAPTFVEPSCGSHLYNMTKLSLAILIFILAACGQNKPSTKTFETTTSQQLNFDTGKIAILPVDTNHFLFENATAAPLTNQDLKSIGRLLSASVQTHNSKQDTAKEFNEFIDLGKYRIQYVPFINSKGEKKVYVNAFCSYYGNFNSTGWKKYLVSVDDGGSCFFHLTINLTKDIYEEFYTNGYG